mmetsp:Transcript_56007/g.120548  ORF Transcript_56007/g.120548 Transcript_56007/m.120548 type:complete len:156 (-) Transcript_56007:123-590(-)
MILKGREGPPPPPPPPPAQARVLATSATATTTALPTPEECKTKTIAALNTAAVSGWRLGNWEYGGMGHRFMWPGGAPQCASECEANEMCMHWDYNCKNLNCYFYGGGGYEEDGDPQFGRDFMFLGDSTHNERRLKELAVEEAGKKAAAASKGKEL